jgi:hypothetical protein
VQLQRRGEVRCELSAVFHPAAEQDLSLLALRAAHLQ